MAENMNVTAGQLISQDHINIKLLGAKVLVLADEDVHCGTIESYTTVQSKERYSAENTLKPVTVTFVFTSGAQVDFMDQDDNVNLEIQFAD